MIIYWNLIAWRNNFSVATHGMLVVLSPEVDVHCGYR